MENGGRLVQLAFIFILFVALGLTISLNTISPAFGSFPQKFPSWHYEATKTANSVEVSGDGKYVVAGTDENYVYLFGSSDKIPLDAYDMGSSVSLIGCCFDGCYVAASSGNNLVLLSNDGTSLQQVWSFVNDPFYNDPAGIHSLDFSFDGRFLVVGTWGYDDAYSYVHLFDVTDGTNLWSYTVRAHESPWYQYDYVSVDMSSDGQYIAAGSTLKHNIYLFERTNSTPIYSFDIGSSVNSISFSSNADYIVGGDKLFYFQKDVATPIWSKNLEEPILHAKISYDGSRIVAITNNHVYLLDNYGNVLSLRQISNISQLATTSDVVQFVLSSERWIYSFSVNETEGIASRWQADMDESVSSLSISENGQYIGATSGSEILLLDDKQNADLIPIKISFSDYDIYEGETITVSMSVENIGNLSSNPSRIDLYDGTSLIDFLTIGEIEPGSVIELPVDCILTPGSEHHIIVVVDSSNMIYEQDEDNNVLSKNVTILPYSSALYENLTLAGSVRTLSVSNDGRYVTVGGQDGYVYFFVRNKMSPLWSYHVGSSVENVKVSGNSFYVGASQGNTLSTFSRYNRFLWSFVNDPFYNDPAGIHSLDFSFDGRFLVVGTWGYDDAYSYVHLFDVTDGTNLWSYTVRAHESPWYQYDYVSVDMSSDGQYIAAGSTLKHNIYLFDQTGLIFHYDAGAAVNSISISNDGQYFVAGGNKVYYFDRNVIVPKWNKQLVGEVSKAIISDGGEYVVATSGTELYLLSGSNGDIVWNYTFAEVVGADFSKNGEKVVAVAGNTAYVFSILTDGNPATDIHDPIGTIQLEQTISSFVISNDGAYVLLGSGTNIYVFLFAKPPTFLTDPSTSVTYSHEAYISTRLTDEGGEPISNADIAFSLYDEGWDSIGSNPTDAGGYSSIIYKANLPAGIYPLEVSYDGGMYCDAASFTGNLTIYKKPTSISLTHALIIKNYGEEVVISSTLEDDEGNPMAGTLVQFQVCIDDEWVVIGQNATDNLGHTSLRCTPYLLPRNYPLAALFEGNDYYEDCRDDGTLSIEKKITLLSDPSTSTLYNDLAVSETRLTDWNGHPVEGANITIWIYVDEAWRFVSSDLTNATGYATFSYLASFQPNTYRLEARYTGDQFYHEIRAEGTVHIFSRVIIDESLASRNRADTESVQTVLFHAKWEHNDSSVDRGIMYINGTERITDSTGWASLEVTSSIVERQTWAVTAVNCHGATAFSQICKGPSIAWDEVRVTLTVDDQRIDIATNASIVAHAFYAYDGEPFEGLVVLNDTSFIASSVGKKTYTVAHIVDPKYGLTASSSNTVSVVWDEVNIGLTADSERFDVGTKASIAASAIYVYDSEPFRGSIFLNDTGYTSPFVGEKSYCADYITDDVHGLTAFSTNTVSVIWDEVNVKLTVDDQRIDVGENATITKQAIYVYDGKPFEGTIILNDTLGASSPCKKNYRVKEIVDQYGLSAFSSNIVSVIWDRVDVTLTVENTRVEVGDTITVDVNAVYAYDGRPLDGSVVLNSTVFASHSVRKQIYSVSHVVDKARNLTAYSSNALSVVWDSIEVQPRLSWTTPGVVEIVVSLHYSYDGISVDDAEVLIDEMEAFNAGSGDYVCRMSGWDLSVRADVEIRKALFETVNLSVEGIVPLNLLSLIVLPVTGGISSTAYVVSWWRKRKILRSSLLRRRVEDEISQMKTRKGMIDLTDFSKECKIDRNVMIEIIDSLGIKGVYFSKDKERIFSKEWLRTQLVKRLRE